MCICVILSTDHCFVRIMLTSVLELLGQGIVRLQPGVLATGTIAKVCHCKTEGLLLAATVWLYQFHLWDPCYNYTLVIKVALSGGVYMPLRLAVTNYS